MTEFDHRDILVKQYAQILHRLFCDRNHNDDCGWEYEKCNGPIKRWEGKSHRKWLNVAQELTTGFSSSDVRATVDRLRRADDVIQETKDKVYDRPFYDL